MSMGSLDGEQRKATLAAILERDGIIRLSSAAEELGVSTMTVRRDIVDLEIAGVLRRVRGGAMPALGPKPFRERSARSARAKSVIAEKALRLVPNGGAVALDASSTVAALGATLGNREGIIVATNSWEVFQAVRRTGGPRPLLIGGEPEEHTDSFVGPIACEAAASMLYARFFASASAIDVEHGSSDVSLSEAQVKRRFASVAGETVLCVDATKLEQQDVARSFDWEAVSVLITELDPRDHRLDAYRERVELL
ncbi:DeoR/GlpR family DNA-binding transcription regulator [Microbacterium sp. LBN7]|uniref:DeoR/GlpR family DNA-binding transcription regulator n=1 Tax=Microbacterium sp. LBN7 TaxID=3129773 RepID=UPI003250D03F